MAIPAKQWLQDIADAERELLLKTYFPEVGNDEKVYLDDFAGLRIEEVINALCGQIEDLRVEVTILRKVLQSLIGGIYPGVLKFDPSKHDLQRELLGVLGGALKEDKDEFCLVCSDGTCIDCRDGS